MKKTLLIIAAISSFVSCVKDTEQAEQKEIAFTAAESFSADVITKATAVASISKFYVTATTTSTTGSETKLWDNKEFTKASNDTKFTSSGIYWPASQKAMHFYASNLSPVFSGGDVTVSANTDTDVVCAYLDSPSWKSVNQLTFDHILARLGRCTITAPEGYTGSNLSITIKPMTGGTYNLRTASWSSQTEASSAVVVTNSFDGGGTVNDIYLIPGQYTLTAKYTLTKGTYSQSFTKTASVTVSAGCINLISATLPQGNATDIQFTVSVNEWTNHSITATF